MLPNMAKIAGELLPSVFHVAGDQIPRMPSVLEITVMHGCSSVRFCNSFRKDPFKQVMDLSAVAHLATLESSVPFVSFFDGFLTSHGIQKFMF